MNLDDSITADEDDSANDKLKDYQPTSMSTSFEMTGSDPMGGYSSMTAARSVPEQPPKSIETSTEDTVKVTPIVRLLKQTLLKGQRLMKMSLTCSMHL